jgi:hypothetical protein
VPLVLLNLSPEKRVLRQFGWIACAAGLVGGVLVWRGWWLDWLVDGDARALLAVTLAATGLFSGAAALVWPAANRPLYVLLSIVSYPIGFVVSMLVLTVLFFVVITPMAFLLKLAGNDPLSRRRDAAAGSYWVDARPPRPKEDYFRQY